MENRISIPKPCHENWNEMLPQEQGRHCLACSKTVMDFTGWEPDAILGYLQSKKQEKVCGRFNAEQVSPLTPDEGEVWVRSVWGTSMPLLRKIAAVIVICFGLMQGDSYGQKIVGKIAAPRTQPTEQIQGEPAIQETDTTKTVSHPIIDTLRPQPQIMGMIAPYHPNKKKTDVAKPDHSKKKKR